MTREVPQDHEAERWLLASLAAPGRESEAAEWTAVLCEEDFLDPAHQAVLRALRTVSQAGKEVHSLSLRDALREAGDLGRVGDLQGLQAIMLAPEVEGIQPLVERLQEMRKLRELIRIGAGIVRSAEACEPSGETVAQAGERLASLAQVSDQGNAERVYASTDDVLAMLGDRMSGHHTSGTRIKGWPRLNGILQGGFQPGNLIILAARPGIGKTSLALNWLLRAGSGVMFSLEMTREECIQRIMADAAGVDLRAMIETRDRAAFARVAEAKTQLDRLPIHVCDRSKITPPEIQAQVDRIITREGKPGLVVVDYLQLLSGGTAKDETHRLAELTRALKLLAKDRRVPVLVLSQLNREVEKRQGGKPQLADLRDSGAIEQDADLVAFIHRKVNDVTAQLVIAKHRNGPTMDLPLVFRSGLTRYEEEPGDRACGHGGQADPEDMASLLEQVG